MNNQFALLLHTCGLSHREAAELLNIRPDTVKSWAAGRRNCPDAVLADLAAIADSIDRAAEQTIDQIDSVAAAKGAPETIELGIASDDHEAQSLGWPTVSVQRAMLGLVLGRGIAMGYRFAIVPRGSTPSTAAAADAHDR